MTTAQPSDAPLAEALELVPTLTADFERRDVDGHAVVWSALAEAPTALDPVATVMLDVLDGEASIGELAVDVHEAVGLPLEDAQRQVTRVVELYAGAGLLEPSTSTSSARSAIDARELFLSDPTPCAENASALGTVTLHLRFGERVLRVACDSRRGAKKLRAALAEHVVEPEAGAPLGFVLTAPQGLQRHHKLEDRSGFVLSDGRGLDAGLHALACHLTALLPPAAGTVRVRARALATADTSIVCLSPLLYFPPLDDAALAAAGLGLVDRLALDLDVETGQVLNPGIPWPALAALGPERPHVGTPVTGPVTAVVALAGASSAPPSRAAMIAALAAGALHGETGDVLDACVRLVEGAAVRTAPAETEPLLATLGELAGRPA